MSRYHLQYLCKKHVEDGKLPQHRLDLALDSTSPQLRLASICYRLQTAKPEDSKVSRGIRKVIKAEVKRAVDHHIREFKDKMLSEFTTTMEKYVANLFKDPVAVARRVRPELFQAAASSSSSPQRGPLRHPKRDQMGTSPNHAPRNALRHRALEADDES